MTTCADCKFCVMQDYGYSNYTVEGTDADCILGKNPGLPSDRFYGEAEVLKFGESCAFFSKGDAIEMCVEDSIDEAATQIFDSEVLSAFRSWSEKN